MSENIEIKIPDSKVSSSIKDRKVILRPGFWMELIGYEESVINHRRRMQYLVFSWEEALDFAKAILKAERKE